MQGENAILEIPEKIKLANYNNEDDFIIICRGGGDLNDLKVFDDEKIVRAIISSDLPVITAIGHEINISLSDLVSDKSYKTPTAAAEGCFPDISQIFKEVVEFKKIITKDYNSIIIKNTNARLEIHQRLLKLQPIFKYKEVIASNEAKLAYAVENLNNTYRQYLKNLSEVVVRKFELVKMGLNNFLLNKVNQLKNLSLKLELKNPKTILEMGYAKVFNKLNDVKSVDDVSIGDDIKTLLNDGEIISKVISKKENAK